MPWNEFRTPLCLWMHNLITLEEWLAAPPEHAVWNLPGVNIFTHMHDSLHTVDKGVSPHIEGNSLFTLVHYNPQVTGSLEERCQCIWAGIQEEYVSQGIDPKYRISNLSMSMICKSAARSPTAYPEMHQVKARQARYLVGPVRALAQRYNTGSLQDTHRLIVLQRLERYYTIIESYGHYLPSGVSAELLQCVHELLLHYTLLARMAMSAGLCLWLVVPKFHYFYHLAWFGRYANPKMGWTYADEDFVGRIARVAKSVVPGVGALRLGRFLVNKYLLVLATRFHRRQRCSF